MSEEILFPRPARTWLTRLIDGVGYLGRRLGLPRISLHDEALLKLASRITGLSDFGAVDFREPLRIFLSEAEQGVRFTPSGRLMLRRVILDGLCNRLRLQRLMHEHPEILRSRLPNPLIIVSVPRTGTTLLYNLLAQDPASRPLLAWEAAHPAPLPSLLGKRWDRRKLQMVIDAAFMRCFVPGLELIYPFNPRGPEECHHLLRNTFYYVPGMVLPSYRQWFRNLPREKVRQVYADYYRQLQALEWQSPARGHWLLKSPAHLWAIDSLLAVMPEARIIQTHRDPCKSVPSLCSLFAVVFGGYTDRIATRAMGPLILELCNEALHRAETARQSMGEQRFIDVSYTRLTADPVAVLREVYDRVGCEFTAAVERRVRAYLAAHPEGSRAIHSYSLAQFGLDEAAILSTLGWYCQRYDIEIGR